ncbi:MAG: hypothetical protein ABIE43_03420 [Patescibacteria group bacterium]
MNNKFNKTKKIRQLKKYLFLLFILCLLAAPIRSILAVSLESSTNISLTVESFCGDGTVDAGEECDGNAGVISGYTCNNTCQLEEDVVSGGVFPPEVYNELNIFNISVEVEANEANINWATNKEAYCQTTWGRTPEYMDGVINEINKKREHSANILNLLPDTDYYYQLYCWDDWGNKKYSQNLKFQTSSVLPPVILPDEIAPSNVKNFEAIADENKILLKWTNPDDKDFIGVKILRSEEFYPQNIIEGKEIYNGSGEFTIDEDVIPDKRYYYTNFAYDNDGNYSSGAIASAIIYLLLKPGDEEILPLPLAPPAPPEEIMEINFVDFEFYVANNTIKIINKNNTFPLLPGTILRISTDKNKYPDVLKSIIITLAPNSTFEKKEERAKEAKSYLLRIDENKEYYTTNFTVPAKIEDYDLYIYFLNYNYSRIAETSGLVNIKEFGKIISADFRNKLTKYVLAAEENISETPVYLANITLHKIENNESKKWEGIYFSQFNPLMTNKYGQYGFIVPNGKYILKASKEDYYDYESLPFLVENNLVNESINLIHIPKLKFSKYFWLFLILLLLLIHYLFKKRQEEEKKTGRVKVAAH